MADDLIPCPGCGDTGQWQMERTIHSVDYFTVVDDGAGGYIYDLGDQRDADWDITSISCSGCGWSIATTKWDEFVAKATMPDPSALLALRNRAASD